MIDLYKQKQRLKISLNDQLEDFYENCKNSKIIEECVYYYHTKRLDSEELQLSKTRFEKFRSRSMRNIDGFNVPRWMPSWLKIRKDNKRKTSIFVDEILVRENPFDNMEKNEYLLYNCFRITLTLTPQAVLSCKPNELDDLIKYLTPFLYTSLWRSSRPRGDVDVPRPGLTKVIGLDTTSSCEYPNTNQYELNDPNPVCL